MGIVYLARQASLGRLVALKMLPPELSADEVALARFRREIRHLARCEHPHIVKVLSSGRMPDGELFYTMEYVPGCDLESVWRELSGTHRMGDASTLGSTTWSRAVLDASRKQREQTAKRNPASSAAGRSSAAAAQSADAASESAPPAPPVLPLPPLPDLPSRPDDAGGYVRRVAALIRDAASALQVVHDQQIVHRDIKPANMMLTPDGKRVVLMDFGLAKGETKGVTSSRHGGLLGTLRYAAPEQLAAASLKVGPQADVRGLGVTLWEMLTRQQLFGDAQDEKQLAHAVMNQDPPLLRRVDPTLDRDLEAIVARATDRDSHARIQSAKQLADYLQSYLNGEPLPIRPPTLREVAVKWVRGHKGLVGTVSAATSAVLLTAIVSFISVNSARIANEDLARRNAKLADDEKTSREQAEKLARDNADLAVKEQGARATAERQVRVSDSSRLAMAAREERELHPVRGLLLAVEAVRATTRAGEAPAPAARQALVDLLQSVGGTPFGLPLGASDNRRWQLTEDEQEVRRLFDMASSGPTGTRIPLPTKRSAAEEILVSNNGLWLAVPAADHKHVLVWRVAAKEVDAEAISVAANPHEFAFSSDGRWLATVAASHDKNAIQVPGEPEAPAVPAPAPAAPPAPSARDRGAPGPAIQPVAAWFAADPPAPAPPDVGGNAPAPPDENATAPKPPPAGEAKDENPSFTIRICDLTTTKEAIEPRTLTVLAGQRRDWEPRPLFSENGRWLVVRSVRTAVNKLAIWDLMATGRAAAARFVDGTLPSNIAAAFSLNRWLVTRRDDGVLLVYDLAAADPLAMPREFPAPNGFRGDGCGVESQWAHGSSRRPGGYVRETMPNEHPAPAPGNDLAPAPPAPSAEPGGSSAPAAPAPPSDDSAAPPPAAPSGKSATPPPAPPAAPSAKPAPAVPKPPSAPPPTAANHPRPSDQHGSAAQASLALAAADAPPAPAAPAAPTPVEPTPDPATETHGEGELLIWDLQSADPVKSLRILREHGPRYNYRVAFSADSRRLAVGSQDGLAQLWTLPDHGEPIANAFVARLDIAIYDIDLSPNGRWLYAATGDSEVEADFSIRVWDLAARDPAGSIAILRGHESMLDDAVFSSDSRVLSTFSIEGAATLGLGAAERSVCRTVAIGPGTNRRRDHERRRPLVILRNRAASQRFWQNAKIPFVESGGRGAGLADGDRSAVRSASAPGPRSATRARSSARAGKGSPDRRLLGRPAERNYSRPDAAGAVRLSRCDRRRFQSRWPAARLRPRRWHDSGLESNGSLRAVRVSNAARAFRRGRRAGV